MRSVNQATNQVPTANQVGLFGRICEPTRKKLATKKDKNSLIATKGDLPSLPRCDEKKDKERARPSQDPGKQGSKQGVSGARKGRRSGTDRQRERERDRRQESAQSTIRSISKKKRAKEGELSINARPRPTSDDHHLSLARPPAACFSVVNGSRCAAAEGHHRCLTAELCNSRKSGSSGHSPDQR